MDKFTDSESIYREIELTAAGVVIDTDDLLTIVVTVLHKITLATIVTYSLSGGTVIKKSPASEGKIYIIIPKDTATYSGIYILKVTTTEAAAGYPDNIRTRVGVENNFIIEK